MSSQGGWGGWGGWNGGAQTLGDAFGNPMTAHALTTGRDSMVDPRATGSYMLPPPPLAGRMDRWEPWVRSATVLQCLLAEVQFRSSARGVVWSAPGSGRKPVTVARLRAPSEAAFRRQLTLVLRWAELREERMGEVLSQVENQTAMLASVPFLHPARTPRTLELLAIVIQFAISVELRFKHELGCWRPVEYSPHVQPMITTPGHGSLPSGHATQAYAVAQVLRAVLGFQAQAHDQHPTVVQLQRQAARIATNRVIAGVHFPVDSIAGRLLGTAVGDYLLMRCGQPPRDAQDRPAWIGRHFDGRRRFDAEAVEFRPHAQPLAGGADAPFYAEDTALAPLAAEALWVGCWDAALKEWPAERRGLLLEDAP